MTSHWADKAHPPGPDGHQLTQRRGGTSRHLAGVSDMGRGWGCWLAPKKAVVQAEAELAC